MTPITNAVMTTTIKTTGGTCNIPSFSSHLEENFPVRFMSSLSRDLIRNCPIFTVLSGWKSTLFHSEQGDPSSGNDEHWRISGSFVMGICAQTLRLQYK